MSDHAAPVADRGVIVVSPMQRRHLDGVLAIESRVYPRPWSASLFEDELGRRGRCYVVAREGVTIVGYAGLLMIAEDGHVATVAVDPDRQGRSIATRLLVELVRGAVGIGAEQLTLEVRASNTRAQALYRRFGFAPVGVRKEYYADNREDAIVMWVHEVATDEYRERLAGIEATFVPPTVRRGFDDDPVPAPTAPVAHPAARVGTRPVDARMERS